MKDDNLEIFVPLVLRCRGVQLGADDTLRAVRLISHQRRPGPFRSKQENRHDAYLQSLASTTEWKRGLEGAVCKPGLGPFRSKQENRHDAYPQSLASTTEWKRGREDAVCKPGFGPAGTYRKAGARAGLAHRDDLGWDWSRSRNRCRH